MDEISAPELTPLRGHREVQTQLKEATERGRLHHSLLLHGSKGIGKSKLALFIAAWLLSGREQTSNLFADEGSAGNDIWEVDTQDAEARLVFSLTHPDVLHISAQHSEDNKSGQIKTETLRKVKQFLSQTPARTQWRIVIIDSLDEVNVTGANAMLKTLEEPPENSLIILLSSQISAILPTILSRCSLHKCVPLDAADCLEVIKNLYPDGDENIIESLSVLCGGSPGTAEMLQLAQAGSLFEQSCMMISHPIFNIKECRAVADKWGAGGAANALRRQSATYLFSHLLSYAALQASRGQIAGNMESIQTPEFCTSETVQQACTALASRHNPASLADMQLRFNAEMHKAERLYLDAAPILVQFFQEMHSQRAAN